MISKQKIESHLCPIFFSWSNLPYWTDLAIFYSFCWRHCGPSMKDRLNWSSLLLQKECILIHFFFVFLCRLDTVSTYVAEAFLRSCMCAEYTLAFPYCIRIYLIAPCSLLLNLNSFVIINNELKKHCGNWRTAVVHYKKQVFQVGI